MSSNRISYDYNGVHLICKRGDGPGCDDCKRNFGDLTNLGFIKIIARKVIASYIGEEWSGKRKREIDGRCVREVNGKYNFMKKTIDGFMAFGVVEGYLKRDRFVLTKNHAYILKGKYDNFLVIIDKPDPLFTSNHVRKRWVMQTIFHDDGFASSAVDIDSLVLAYLDNKFS